MLIGTLSQRSGLSRDTIRYYVQRGLLKPEQASGNNRYWHFAEGDLQRLRLIELGQKLGFTLAEISPLLEDYLANRLDTKAELAVLKQQLARVEEKLVEFQELKAYLEAKIITLSTTSSSTEHGLDAFAHGITIAASDKRPKAMFTHKKTQLVIAPKRG